MDYGGSVSTDRGRCFRWIYDDQGKPDNCPQSVVASGLLQVGDRWYGVDSCGEHSGQLRKRGRVAAPVSDDLPT